MASAAKQKKTKSVVKHAPGPWAFREGDRERRDSSRVFKANDEEFLIAHVICDFRNDMARAEDIANARLIAAAPDLLEACRNVLSWLDGGQSVAHGCIVAPPADKAAADMLRNVIGVAEGGAS